MKRPHLVASDANRVKTATVKKPSPTPPSSRALDPAHSHAAPKRVTTHLVRPPSDPRIDEPNDHLAAVEHAHRQHRRWSFLVLGVSLLGAGVLYLLLDRQGPVVIPEPNHTQTSPRSESTIVTAPPAKTPTATTTPATAQVAPSPTQSTPVPSAPVATDVRPQAAYSTTGTPDPLTLAGAASVPPTREAEAAPAAATPPEATAVPLPQPAATAAATTPESTKAVAETSSLTLSASTATITSKTARLQGKGSSNPHIGSWNDREGGLSWTTTVSQPGRYSVTITYACNKSGAGGVLKLTAGTSSITDTVVDTGSWDTFAPHTLQQPIEITQTGEITVTLEPQTKKSAAFMKFTSLVLTPVAATP